LVLTTVAIVLAIVSVLAYVFWPRKTPPPRPVPRPTPIHVTAPTPPPKPPTPPKPPVRLYNAEFTVTLPNAHTVSLSGEFNNWSATTTPMHKRPDGQWAVTQQLAAGRYKYKLIVDGKWIPDPENPTQVDDPDYGKCSVVPIGQ
jgi:hypothetical protein